MSGTYQNAARNDSRASASIGLPWVLFFIFLILKLTGAIAWSWWWVFAPLWIPWALVVVVVLVMVVVAGLRGDRMTHPRRF